MAPTFFLVCKGTVTVELELISLRLTLLKYQIRLACYVTIRSAQAR